MPMPCTVGALINTARLQYPTHIHHHHRHLRPNPQVITILFHENVWSCSVNAIRPHCLKSPVFKIFNSFHLHYYRSQNVPNKCGALRFNQSVVDHFILSSNIINSSKSIQSWWGLVFDSVIDFSTIRSQLNPIFNYL